MKYVFEFKGDKHVTHPVEMQFYIYTLYIFINYQVMNIVGTS